MEEAIRNMLVFPLSDISSQSIEPHEVSEFLTRVFEETGFADEEEEKQFTLTVYVRPLDPGLKHHRFNHD